MINWLTENIGTGAYLDIVDKFHDSPIVDVRDLVDKDGNTSKAILGKIDEALDILKSHNKVVICCDYGMSRSNSIAAGVISKYTGTPLSKVVQSILTKVSAEGVKVEVLNSVFEALNCEKARDNDISRRILITGASGFIGKKLLKRFSDKKILAEGITSKDIDLISDSISVDLLVKEKNINTIVHLANPKIYTLSVSLGDSLVMLKNILEVCRINKIKLVYVSSWEVYSGYKVSELLADESVPLYPKGAYGESKWLSEELIKHYANVYGLQYSILRSSPVYGIGSDKPKFIYSFIDMAKKNQPITTHSYVNGAPKIDLLNIDDLILAIDLVTEKGSGIYNIGSGKAMTTPQIAEIIVRRFGASSTISQSSIDSFYPGIVMNTVKANRDLMWKPTVSFQDFIDSI